MCFIVHSVVSVCVMCPALLVLSVFLASVWGFEEGGVRMQGVGWVIWVQLQYRDIVSALITLISQGTTRLSCRHELAQRG